MSQMLARRLDTVETMNHLSKREEGKRLHVLNAFISKLLCPLAYINPVITLFWFVFLSSQKFFSDQEKKNL